MISNESSAQKRETHGITVTWKYIREYIGRFKQLKQKLGYSMFWSHYFSKLES